MRTDYFYHVLDSLNPQSFEEVQREAVKVSRTDPTAAGCARVPIRQSAELDADTLMFMSSAGSQGEKAQKKRGEK